MKFIILMTSICLIALIGQAEDADCVALSNAKKYVNEATEHNRMFQIQSEQIPGYFESRVKQLESIFTQLSALSSHCPGDI